LIPEDRLSPRALVETLDALLVNPAYLADVAEKARNIGRPNAAQGLADVVCRLASANGDAGHGIASDPPPEEAA
jgi:UDP-N-acetylglucosamine--N-acetylmuramyl-(pentapeptide) pyrophosphoryl-undecaprenol N-acetylglucosamine transferase